VQIVTAAIDTELHEMHLPLNKVIMGEAAGDADFAVRHVDGWGTSNDQEEDDIEDNAEGEPLTEKGEKIGDGFKLPTSQAEELKFSRKKKEDGEATAKRAWVVSPGKLICAKAPY
jgi:uridine kinase